MKQKGIEKALERNMGATVKITIPGEEDLEFYKQIGHIVFKMDQLRDSNLVESTLLTHIKKNKKEIKENSEPKSENPKIEENEEIKIATTTIEELNKRAEL